MYDFVSTVCWRGCLYFISCSQLLCQILADHICGGLFCDLPFLTHWSNYYLVAFWPFFRYWSFSASWYDFSIALWSDRIVVKIFTFVNLCRFVLWPNMWFTLENVLCALRRMCVWFLRCQGTVSTNYSQLFQFFISCSYAFPDFLFCWSVQWRLNSPTDITFPFICFLGL